MKRKLRLTYIFTHHIRWVAFEWAAKYIDHSRFEVDYIILNEGDPMIDFLKQENIPYKVTTYQCLGDTPDAIKFICEHLVANQTDIVHAHFTGDLAAMQAAYYANVPVRVYTRHHQGIKWKPHYPRSRFELLWASATNIITLTERGKEIMISEGAPQQKITIIPHGFDLREFENIEPERIERIRNRYLPNRTGPVVGVASRYVPIKGVQYTIEAFKKVLEKHPDAILLLAGTEHDYANIKEKLAGLPPWSFVEIDFEEDLFALFRLFDVFVHVPIDPDGEAFGQVYIEAMLSEVPTVITLAGIAHEYAVHKENAWVVGYKNSGQIAEGILNLLQDSSLREKIIENALAVARNYSIEKHMRRLEALYQQQLSAREVLATHRII